MPMYNLLYNSKNFRKTTGSFWNYYLDIPSSGYNDDNNKRTRIFYPNKNSEGFNYKNKIIGSLGDNLPVVNNLVKAEINDVKIVVPFKNLGNFMFNLDFLMINANMKLILTWTEDCVLTEKATREEKAREYRPPMLNVLDAMNRPEDLKFRITNCKMYVPVVTLQAEYQNHFCKHLKLGISIDITWNKYRSQVINQTATNYLSFFVDPTFNNVNRLFILAFPNEEDRNSFSKYYTPTVEIKDYNIILDGEPFYEIPIKNKEETYKAITELMRNDLLRTGNKFNFEYFCKHYKLIAIDLSKQNSDFKNQQINFIGKLEQDSTIFFITEEKETTGLEFLQII